MAAEPAQGSRRQVESDTCRGFSAPLVSQSTLCCKIKLTSAIISTVGRDIVHYVQQTIGMHRT